MKKSIASILIAALLAFGGLSGCNNSSGSNSNNSDNNTVNPSGGDNTNPSSGGDSSGNNGGESGNNGGESGGNNGGGQQGGGEGQGGEGQGGNGEQGLDNEVANVVQGQQTDWPDDAKAIMRNHLHGIVLPYIDIMSTVAWYSNMQYVGITGGDVAGTDLADYAALFTANDGWLGGDYSAEVNQPTGTCFAFTKFVNTNEGKRGIAVEFTAYVGGEPAREGTFQLYANDPYSYTFPSSFANAIIENAFRSNVTLPPITADYFTYESTEYEIFCYLESNADDGGYKAILLNAGWTVEGQKDDEGFYVAHSSDEKVVVRFKYSQGVLIIRLGRGSGWPTADIQAKFTWYGYEGYEIPRLDSTSSTYRVAENANNMMLLGQESAYIDILNITQTVFERYPGILRSNGWEVDGQFPSYSASKLTSNGTANINFNFNYSSNSAQIGFNLRKDGEAIVNWPARQVANYLTAAVTETVPAYPTAVSNYAFMRNANPDYLNLVMYVTNGQEQATVEAYRALLTGWTQNGNINGYPRYVSPNGQIAVTVGSDSSHYQGQVFIRIEQYSGGAPVSNAWDASKVNTKLRALGVSENILPAINTDQLTEIKIFSDYVTDYSFNITCIVADTLSTNDKENIIFNYRDFLVAEDFEYGEKNYLYGPTEEIMVEVFLDSRERITIKVMTYAAEWPSDIMYDIYSGHDVLTEDRLPVFFGPKAFSKVEGSNTLKCEFFTEAAAADMESDYINILLDIYNYSYNYDKTMADDRNENGNATIPYYHYDSQNGVIELVVYRLEKNVFFEIHYPADEVTYTLYFRDASWWNADAASTWVSIDGADAVKMTHVEWVQSEGYNYWSIEIPASAQTIVFERHAGNSADYWGAKTTEVSLSGRENYNMYDISNCGQAWESSGHLVYGEYGYYSNWPSAQITAALEEMSCTTAVPAFVAGGFICEFDDQFAYNNSYFINITGPAISSEAAARAIVNQYYAILLGGDFELDDSSFTGDDYTSQWVVSNDGDLAIQVYVQDNGTKITIYIQGA